MTDNELYDQFETAAEPLPAAAPPGRTDAGEDGEPTWRIMESSVEDLVAQLTDGAAISARAGHQLIRTGFATLDKALGGGMHIGDLAVVGGLPGAGKTIATLQWARAMALEGNDVLYLCYEHDVATLLGRLFSMEIGTLGVHDDPADQHAVAEAIGHIMAGGGHETLDKMHHPLARAALARIAEYSDRLILAQAPSWCDLDAIEDKVERGDYDAVVIDYLQKVPMGQLTGIDRYTNIVEGLKDMALDYECLVIAVSAVDSHALQERRLKLDGLRGAHALAHEADVVMTLNAKINVVSKAHLAFDATRFDEFNSRVVFTIEKNRRGEVPVTVEFDKDFAHYRFEPKGKFVAERLIDDILTVE